MTFSRCTRRSWGWIWIQKRDRVVCPFGIGDRMSYTFTCSQCHQTKEGSMKHPPKITVEHPLGFYYNIGPLCDPCYERLKPKDTKDANR